MALLNYGQAIRAGFEYLLTNHQDVFVMGQGLWSPWYVGNSMTDLDKQFGVERIIDTPVSESACTGAALGASLAGMRPIMVHPRMDFMLYGLDSIVNQASKWSSMFGGQARAPLTIRSIINRGGEQGAQHSQALHSWFAHIPGLRVVMPYSVRDARDLLISSVLCNDPVIFIDDRWLYEEADDLGDVDIIDLSDQRPKAIHHGDDLTIVGAGFSTKLALDAAREAANFGVSCDVFDMRVLNPFYVDEIASSVEKTGRLLVIDGSWSSCGFSSEVIASVIQSIDLSRLRVKPQKITLPDAPAPTPSILEASYYPSKADVISAIRSLIA